MDSFAPTMVRGVQLAIGKSRAQACHRSAEDNVKLVLWNRPSYLGEGEIDVTPN
jgi:hypothetical protein